MTEHNTPVWSGCKKKVKTFLDIPPRQLEYARMISVKKVRPTKKLLALVNVYGSVNATARAWGVEYNSLRRFIQGDGGLSLNTAGLIVNATGLSFEDLFTADGE